MNAKEILEQLTELYAQRDLLSIGRAQARDDAIPEEAKAALADIDAEYAPKQEAIAAKIERMEQEAKAAVLKEGESAKGGALHAVLMKGRISWDTKKLDGMMILLPQLREARVEGNPIVSLRFLQK